MGKADSGSSGGFNYEEDPGWDDDGGWGDWGEVGVVEAKDWEAERKKAILVLQIFSGLIAVVLVLLLVRLGFVGWNNTVTSIDLSLSTTPTMAVTPTVVGATQETKVTEASPAPTTTPTLSASANHNGDGNKTPDLVGENIKNNASLYFVILATVAGVLVLLPTLILVGFVFRQADKISKDIQGDLKRLGIVTDEIIESQKRMERWEQADKELRKQLSDILVGGSTRGRKSANLNETDRKSLSGWVDSLLLTNFSVENEPKRPSSIRQSDWDAAISIVKENASRQQTETRVNISEAFKTSRTDEFGKIISKRFGWYEYLIPLIPMTLTIIITIVWSLLPKGFDGFATTVTALDPTSKGLNAYFTGMIATMTPAVAALLSAYLFIVYQLCRRYNRFDITPGAFWEGLKRLLVAFLLGLIITGWSMADNSGAAGEGLGDWLAVGFGVLAGIMPIKTLGILITGIQNWGQEWLTKKVVSQNKDAKIQWGENLAQRLFPRHELALLDDLDQIDVERIEEEGIIGIQGLATCDITQLIVWTPFPTSQIIDWVNQAILFITTGAEPDKSYATIFRAMGLRGATNLLDATNDELGIKRVVNAASALQGSSSEPPIPSAQLAALRAQVKVKDAQDKAKLASDNLAKDENKDKTLKDSRADIESATKLAQECKVLADDAQGKVKAGGDLMKNALDAANAFQARFKTADEKAQKVTEKLKSADDNKKISELAELKTAVKELNDEIAKSPDAKSLVQTLIDNLDKIEQPMDVVESQAKSFEVEIKKLKTSSESTDPVSVPKEVKDGFKALTDAITSAKEQVKKDTTLSKITGDVEKVAELVSNDADGKLKKLTEKDKVTKEEATKLADQTTELLKQIEVAKQAIALAHAKSAGAGTLPPLTRDVLETLLKGLERNANLRRIHRYLTKATMEIPEPNVKYRSNNEFWQADS